MSQESYASIYGQYVDEGFGADDSSELFADSSIFGDPLGDPDASLSEESELFADVLSKQEDTYAPHGFQGSIDPALTQVEKFEESNQGDFSVSPKGYTNQDLFKGETQLPPSTTSPNEPQAGLYGGGGQQQEQQGEAGQDFYPAVYIGDYINGINGVGPLEFATAQVPAHMDAGPGLCAQACCTLARGVGEAHGPSADPEIPNLGLPESKAPMLQDPATSVGGLVLPPRRPQRNSRTEDLVIIKSDEDNSDWLELPTIERPHSPVYVSSIDTPRIAPTTPLAITRKITVVQRIKDTTTEVPIEYSIYQPLQAWGGFTYTERGDLDENIIFDEALLHKFIYDHPLGNNLVLRIEKHPYSFQCRYRDPTYIKCRSKTCGVGSRRNFKVGDFRVAIDEVAGRLAASQENDNDPYFSTCFFHLQCFEELTFIPDLVIRNLLAPDERRTYPKEPSCTRINKMGVSPATISAFVTWRQTAIMNLSEDKDWKPERKETLTCVLWVSSIRKGRKRGRAPPGVTSDDIIAKCSKHPGWGGKRVSGLSVAKMTDMESQGRSHEMVASRNGKTGKKGVRPPSKVVRKQRIKRKAEGEEGDSKPVRGRSVEFEHTARVAQIPAPRLAPGITGLDYSHGGSGYDGQRPGKRPRRTFAIAEDEPTALSGVELTTNSSPFSFTGVVDFLDESFDKIYSSRDFPSNIQHAYTSSKSTYPTPMTKDEGNKENTDPYFALYPEGNSFNPGNQWY